MTWLDLPFESIVEFAGLCITTPLFFTLRRDGAYNAFQHVGNLVPNSNRHILKQNEEWMNGPSDVIFSVGGNFGSGPSNSFELADARGVVTNRFKVPAL
jgi:hypothetical protein